jgi:hypothetical protein
MMGSEGQGNRAFYGVENLLLFQKLEDFINYFIPIIDRFPKSEKFALVSQIKNLMYDMAKEIIRTNKKRDKLAGWYDFDASLEMLRFFIRHARKRKYLSPNSYETAVKKLAEVGRIVGGLIKG